MSCRMVYMGKRMPKSSIRNPIFVESSTSDRTAFRNFGVPQPQIIQEIINHQLDEYTIRVYSSRALQYSNTMADYGGTRVVMSTCEPESMTRTRNNMFLANRNTCSNGPNRHAHAVN